jgi:TolB-like protein
MQVFDVVLPAFGAPDWVFRVLIAILIAGLPIALVLAWSFEITPEKTDTPAAKRIGINGYLVAVLSLAIAFLLFDRFYGLEQSSTESAPQGFTASDYKSIAVLPFKNLSANQEDLYFSDGVMEAILNELSLIRELKVISRTSVEGYRDTTKPVTQIGQELDVAHVLEGSVQRAGDKVRVTAQLIAAQDDRHLWSRNYDRALSDIFAIQSEIANAIASNLKLILTDSEQKMMENAPTSELRAYDAFLRGSHVSFQGYFTIRSVDDVRESLRYCQQAIEFDPEFSLAYACIARSYLELGISEFITLDEWLPQARANVEKAISLDPDTWQAYDVLARISFAMGDLAETARYTAKVLEINPNQPDYLANQGSILIRRNEIDAGVDLVLRALELMPGGAHGFDDEDLVSMLQFIASDDLVLRIIDALSNREFEMHRHCIELILAENDSPNNRINAGAASIFTGDFERAREIYESVMVKEEKPGQSFLKYPYKHRYALTLIETGEVERGQALLSEYRKRRGGGHAAGGKSPVAHRGHIL